MRVTIPAASVGITLTVSARALREIARLRDEALKAARQDGLLLFR